MNLARKDIFIAHLLNLHRSIHNLIGNLSSLFVNHFMRRNKRKVRHITKIAKYLVCQKMKRFCHSVIPLLDLEFEISSIYGHMIHPHKLVSPLGNCLLKKLMLCRG